MKVLVLGAGQLARMMDLAGSPLNMDVRAFDVRTNKVVHPLAPELVYGDLQSGIAEADVITAEFEHIDFDTLTACENSGKLLPNSTAIKTGGDRRLEKSLLESCKVANAKHVIVNSKADFDRAITSLELPLILKSALDGYDGKGQWRIKSIEQADVVWQEIDEFLKSAPEEKPQAIVAEQMVPFSREVSLVGARNANGEVAVYPLTENHHTGGVLSVSLAVDSEEALQAQAADVFEKIAKALNYVGVLAIEFFQVGEQLLVNEIAPRVHNSGHWTQQGSDTCQFENHLRAVCNLPLGSTTLVRPTSMINILGEDKVSHDLLAIPSLTMHWYEKEKRAGRKMGHINLCGNTELELAERLQHAASLLDEKAFPDLADFANKFTQRLKANK